ncbi:MAG: sigma-70 family RNA polymerase sigma factor [Bacteroidota bacterium]
MPTNTRAIETPDYLAALRTHDREKLNALYGQFFPDIRQFILRNSGSEAEAYDVFQEGLIVLYRKARDPEFTIRQSFDGYLFTICKQIWFNELRKKGRQKVILEDAPLIVAGSGIEETINERARDKLYRQKFRELGENCRKVLQMFFKGMRMEKIAEAMGFGSVSYAKKRKFQCKQKLFAMIQADPVYAELKL